MSGKVYFITGANRGIGFALAKALAANTSNTVIATARDVAKATELNKLANVHVLELDVSEDASIAALDGKLKKIAADGIDVFISNAGIGYAEALDYTLNIPKSVWVYHYTVNVVGPILITQILYPYMKKKDTKLLYYVSSLAGSLSQYGGGPTSAYSQTKAALNYSSMVLSHELRDEGFISVAVHPGVVSTETGKGVLKLMGEKGADTSAYKSLSITPDQSAALQIEMMGKLTAEDSGNFLLYDGTHVPW